MNKVILRAITAYSRTDMKASTESSVAIKGREASCLGKDYVVLEDDVTHQHVAVYRCMNRGELKRLKRWPPGLTDTMQKPETPKPALKSNVPAILELSPIKGATKVNGIDRSKRKGKAKPADLHENQTDLFE